MHLNESDGSDIIVSHGQSSNKYINEMTIVYPKDSSAEVSEGEQIGYVGYESIVSDSQKTRDIYGYEVVSPSKSQNDVRDENLKSIRKKKTRNEPKNSKHEEKGQKHRCSKRSSFSAYHRSGEYDSDCSESRGSDYSYCDRKDINRGSCHSHQSHSTTNTRDQNSPVSSIKTSSSNRERDEVIVFVKTQRLTRRRTSLGNDNVMSTDDDHKIKESEAEAGKDSLRHVRPNRRRASINTTSSNPTDGTHKTVASKSQHLENATRSRRRSSISGSSSSVSLKTSESNHSLAEKEKYTRQFSTESDETSQVKSLKERKLKQRTSSMYSSLSSASDHSRSESNNDPIDYGYEVTESSIILTGSNHSNVSSSANRTSTRSNRRRASISVVTYEPECEDLEVDNFKVSEPMLAGSKQLNDHEASETKRRGRRASVSHTLSNSSSESVSNGEEAFRSRRRSSITTTRVSRRRRSLVC